MADSFVEAGDDGVDLPAADPPGVIDLLDEQFDGLGLLTVLGILCESLTTGQRVEGYDRKDDVDAGLGHPTSGGTGRTHG
jgi:hypothetical protein